MPSAQEYIRFQIMTTGLPQPCACPLFSTLTPSSSSGPSSSKKKQQQASKQQEEDASGPGNKVAQKIDRSLDITNKGHRESPQAALRYNGLSDVYLGRLSASPSPSPGLALKKWKRTGKS